MRRLALFLPILLLALSCKIDANRPEETSLNDIYRGASELKEDQKLMAEEMCDAFGEKKSTLNTYRGSSVSVTVSVKTCGGSEAQEAAKNLTIISNIGEAPKFSGTGHYISSILTDSHDLMGTFCQSVRSGGDLSDTIGSGVKTKYQFAFKREGFDKIRVAVQTYNDNKRTASDVIFLYTEKVAQQNLTGVVYHRIVDEYCADGTDYSRLAQKFNNFN